MFRYDGSNAALCVGFGTKSNAAAEPGQEPNFELQPVDLDASDPGYIKDRMFVHDELSLIHI